MKGQHQKTIRTLLSSVREYKKASLWCPVFVVLEVLMEVLVPGVMALIIDKGINGGSINYILKVGAVLILMSMLAVFRNHGRNQCGQSIRGHGGEPENGYVSPHTGFFLCQH